MKIREVLHHLNTRKPLPEEERKILDPPPTREDVHKIAIEDRKEMNPTEYFIIHSHEIVLRGLHAAARGIRDTAYRIKEDFSDEIRTIQEQPIEKEISEETVAIRGIDIVTMTTE